MTILTREYVEKFNKEMEDWGVLKNGPYTSEVSGDAIYLKDKDGVIAIMMTFVVYNEIENLEPKKQHRKY
jgi:hypothetical protein